MVDRPARVAGAAVRRRRATRTGPVWTVAPADPDAVERPALMARVVTLLTEARAVPVRGKGGENGGHGGFTVGLSGDGGMGKTTLARQVCAHKAVRRRFRGGCVWVTLGAAPAGSDLAQAVLGAYRDLGGPADAVASITDPDRAGVALGRWLNQLRDVLLVIDDAHRTDQLTPFLQGGAGCIRLVIGRRPEVLPARTPTVIVDQLEPAQARTLLSAGLTGRGAGLAPATAHRLVELTGRWALLVRLANRRLAHDVHGGLDLDQAAARDADQLARTGPPSPDVHDVAGRLAAAGASITASLRRLPPGDRDRLRELAVFAEDAEIPRELRDLLWAQAAGLSQADAERLAQDLRALGLVADHDRAGGGLHLHEVIRSYLRTSDPAALRAASEQFLHVAGMLVPANQWWLLPAEEARLWRNLCPLLSDAGRTADLDRLVGDLRWAEATLRRFGPVALDADLALSTDPTAAALRAALRHNAHLFGPIEPARAMADILLSRLEGIAALEPVVTRYVVGLLPPPRLRAVGVPSDRPHPALRHTLAGHGGPVLDCAIAPDASYVLTACSDGVGRVFDPGTGRLRHTLLGHEGPLTSCTVAPDGSFLLTTSRDGTARIWDPDTGVARQVLVATADPLTGGAIAPDRSFVVTAGADGRTRVWDPLTGQLRHALGTSAAPAALCLVSPRGTDIATSRLDRSVEVWDARTGALRHLLYPHNAGGAWSQRDTGPPTGLAFAGDGSWLVTAGPDAVETWDVATGARRSTVTSYRAAGGPAPVACAVSPDGRWLLAGGRSDPRATNMPGYLGDGHHGPVLSCAIAPDGAWALTTSTDGTARLWDREETGQPGGHRTVLTGHTREVLACAIAPAGDWVVTAGADGAARIWDPHAAGSDQIGRDRHASEVVACALPLAADVLVTASLDGTAKVFSTATGEVSRTLRGHTGAVLDCAVSADGAWAVTASADHTARLWTLPSGQISRVLHASVGEDEPDGSEVARLREPRSHGGPVVGCGIAPDGSFIVTVSADGTARIWDLGPAAGTELSNLGRPQALVGCTVSADGRLVATFGEDGCARLWDPASKTRISLLEGHTATVRACVITPDTAVVVTASDDGTARVWHRTPGRDLVLRHGSPIADCAVAPGGGFAVTAARDGLARVWDLGTGGAGPVLRGHRGSVVSCDIARDGRTVLTAGVDGTARLWDASTGACLAAMRVDGPLRRGRFSVDGRLVALVGQAGHYLFRYDGGDHGQPGQNAGATIRLRLPPSPAG